MKSADILAKVFAIYQEIEAASNEWKKDAKESTRIVAVQNLLRQCLIRAEVNLTTGQTRNAVTAFVPPVQKAKPQPEPEQEPEENQNLVMADNSKEGLEKARKTRKSKKDADSSN